MDASFVAASRRRDLLLTSVMVGVLLTPAWILPPWLSLPWLALGVLLGVPALVVSWRYAPWFPTPSADLPRILRHLALKPHHAFCDLGAGDGRMVVRVHGATGATCTGIELSPLLFLLARLRLAVQGRSGTTVRLGDCHAADLSRFDSLYVWGTAYWVSTPAFRDRLEAGLRKGARLVSYHHPLSGKEPVVVDDQGLRPLYVYVFEGAADPAAPAGDSAQRQSR